MTGEVYTVNKKDLEKKIQKFKKSGSSKLQVIADFDRTLTKAFLDDGTPHTTWFLVIKNKYMSPEFEQALTDLYKKNRSVETSRKISEEKKRKKMEAWWIAAFDNVFRYHLSKAIIQDIIDSNQVYLRNGAFSFFDILKEKDIPLSIFSAGLGDIIKEYLISKDKMSDSTHLISNFLDFNSTGSARGYIPPLIYPTNKKGSHLKNLKHYGELSKRKNILLLGDSVDDIMMADDLDYKNIIKICFLNKDTEKDLDNFEKVYDVILKDSSMQYVNELLRNILREKSVN